MAHRHTGCSRERCSLLFRVSREAIRVSYDNFAFTAVNNSPVGSFEMVCDIYGLPLNPTQFP